MNPWVPMGATIGYNYLQHRRGRPTLCSTTRRIVPRRMVAGAVLIVAFDGLLTHFLNGYPLAIDLTETR